MKSAKIIGLMFLLAGFCFSTFAQNGTEKCMIRGWVQDKEPRKSISLYKVPDPTYVATHNDGIIGAIDNSTEAGEEKPVEIIGFKAFAADWQLIKIRKATTLSGQTLFEGEGWIEAERITARVKSSDGKAVPLYSQPKESSKKVGGSVEFFSNLPSTTFHR